MVLGYAKGEVWHECAANLLTHHCRGQWGWSLQPTLTLTSFQLNFRADRHGERLQVLQLLQKEVSSCSTNAVEQMPRSPAYTRHEDTNAASGLGLTQLVISTQCHNAVLWHAVGRLPGCQAWSCSGQPRPFSHPAYQPPGHRPRHLVWLGSALLSKKGPILGNWGHGSSHPCVSTHLDYCR